MVKQVFRDPIRRLSIWCGWGSAITLVVGLTLASLLSGEASAVISAAPLDLASARTRLAAEIAALRKGDCPKALDGLGKRGQDPEARLLQGFAAARCRAHGLAVDRLAATGAASELEDWRLWTLAESENALGRPSSARRALQELLAEYPGSPLAPRAHLEAAKAAWRAGSAAEATLLLEQVRDRPLDRESRLAAEALSWEIAKGRGDRERQQIVARRLLIDSPLEAARLQVVDVLRDPSGGALDWSRFTDAELLRRSETLVDAQVPAGALTTLDAIPPGRRTTRWVALRARALALDRQGFQALAVLDNAAREGAPAADLVELHWAEAEAVEAALTPRRGVAPPPLAERARLAARREAALWQVARLGAAPAQDPAAPRRAESALRLLFAETSRAGRYVESLRALQELRRLVPSDLSGASFLWAAAWQEYRANRYPVALERWAALERLYPESRYTRSGVYWSARSLDRVGRKTEAAAVFRNLALADTSDFYRRHAVVRLGGKEPTRPTAAPARVAWPSVPAIERARLLSDLGLDDLALVELDALDLGATGVANAAPNRASTALRALALSRRGERRESLRLLGSAFPELGSANQAELPELALELYYPLDYSATVQQLARAQGLPPSLVFGIIHQESAFDHRAISRSGARGLMQLMPPTARELARKLRVPYSLSRMSEPDYSVRLGTTYFRQVLEMFDGQVEIALAGYNAGPTRIRRRWQEQGGEIDTFVEDLSFDETKIYVKRIVALSDSYRRLHPGIG